MKKKKSKRSFKVKEDLPVYQITIASKLCGMPVWLIRRIETHGLVKPRRSCGRTRLYSNKDVEQLCVIGDLLDKNVNFAGVKVVLELKEK